MLLKEEFPIFLLWLCKLFAFVYKAMHLFCNPDKKVEKLVLKINCRDIYFGLDCVRFISFSFKIIQVKI